MKRSDVDLECINECCIRYCGKSTFDRQSNAMPLYLKRKSVIYSLSTQVKVNHPFLVKMFKWNTHQNEQRRFFFQPRHHNGRLTRYFLFVCKPNTRTAHLRVEEQRIKPTTSNKTHMWTNAHNLVEEFFVSLSFWFCVCPVK